MMMISGTLTKFIFSPGANKSVCAPEPYDVGQILQVDIISNAQKSTVTTDCPIQPAVGLESYVETLSRKGNSELSVRVSSVDTIGKGNFGSVWLCRYRVSSVELACKTLVKGEELDGS
ncbi:putative kinase-like domain superfamily, kinase, ATP binding protein [Helianthus anomalus]